MDVVNPVIKRWQQDAAADPDAFWARAAQRRSTGFVPGTLPLSGNRRRSAGSSEVRPISPTTASISRSSAGTAARPALIALNERGEHCAYTYAELLAGVEEIAGALRGLGVERGDRVAIYMPTMAGNGDGDAGDNAHRRDPPRRLRRIRRRRVGGTDGDRWRPRPPDHRHHLPQGTRRRSLVDRPRRARLPRLAGRTRRRLAENGCRSAPATGTRSDLERVHRRRSRAARPLTR